MPGGKGMINGKDGKPFVKGDPRINRKGAPRKLPALEIIIAEVLGTNGKDKSKAQLIIEALMNKAIKGDVRAAELLLDRGYGKVLQQISAEINIPDLPPIQIKGVDT